MDRYTIENVSQAENVGNRYVSRKESQVSATIPALISSTYLIRLRVVGLFARQDLSTFHQVHILTLSLSPVASLVWNTRLSPFPSTLRS
jgi:hypothetical protein